MHKYYQCAIDANDVRWWAKQTAICCGYGGGGHQFGVGDYVPASTLIGSR